VQSPRVLEVNSRLWLDTRASRCAWRIRTREGFNVCHVMSWRDLNQEGLSHANELAMARSLDIT
jgi:hypothetical protein